MKDISTREFIEKFQTEEAARKYFEQELWNGTPVCPHCGSDRVSECKDLKPMSHRCRACRKHFSVRTGTMLEESRLPLTVWLHAIYMMTSARKGISSYQMARELGVTQKTAWYLGQRIREAWLLEEDSQLEGEVETDETYIGGKESNKHASKKLREGRGAVGKKGVVGAKQRDGKVVATPIPNSKKETLHGFIEANVKKGATVYTDEFKAYKGLVNLEYKHETVNHSVGEYIKDRACTNGIESFWALLKRGYYGIYHYMSFKHLHRYVQEFAFRYNTKALGIMGFVSATVKKMVGKHLPYVELIASKV